MADQENPTDDEAWQLYRKNVKPLKKPAKTRATVSVRKTTAVKQPLAPAAQSKPSKAKPKSAPLKKIAAPKVPVLLDQQTRKRISRGSDPVEARLDLHGFTQEQAFDSLCAFVQRCAKVGKRTLLIITGKGRDKPSVLRANVPRWLREAPLNAYVAGYHEAAKADGGQGALYVRLKKKQ